MPKDEPTAELARLEQAEDSLLALFFDEIDNRNGDYFVHVGLPHDVLIERVDDFRWSEFLHSSTSTWMLQFE